MKKFLIVWLPLLILVIAGVGVGFWFLRDTTSQQVSSSDQQTAELANDYSTKTMSETLSSLDSVKGLVPFLGSELTALFQLDTAKIVFFAPTEAALNQFSKDTAVAPTKMIPYHVVVGELEDPVVAENTRLKTKDGQELSFVKKENALYVRDAKGNDVRLRKPIQTKNGKLYIIDKVLLTQ